MPKFEFSKDDAKTTKHPNSKRVSEAAGREGRRRINLFLSASLFKRLRLYTVEEDMKITDVVSEALEQFLDAKSV
ncbi:MAG: hypothetical protein BMS9Abin05_2148 [Rhodothermia bacterium]|nr:MAG: hypothetical protein BMS9Abin05_2148 [Rhodothermia bacterium]